MKRDRSDLPKDWEWATVPQLSKNVGIAQPKISAWIYEGLVKAVNVAQSTATRPRWRIRREHWEAFLASRETAPAPSVPKVRSKRPSGIKSYV